MAYLRFAIVVDDFIACGFGWRTIVAFDKRIFVFARILFASLGILRLFWVGWSGIDDIDALGFWQIASFALGFARNGIGHAAVAFDEYVVVLARRTLANGLVAGVAVIARVGAIGTAGV